jgi:hypothetical protein
VWKKEPMDQLRSKRRIRRLRHASVRGYTKRSSFDLYIQAFQELSGWIESASSALDGSHERDYPYRNYRLHELFEKSHQ